MHSSDLLLRMIGEREVYILQLGEKFNEAAARVRTLEAENEKLKTENELIKARMLELEEQVNNG